jgi:hypothetical protein
VAAVVVAVTDTAHYEVELFGAAHANEGARWRPVRTAPPDDAAPVPLVFGSLGGVLGYVERDQPGAVRIIWVTNDGKRLVVEVAKRSP